MYLQTSVRFGRGGKRGGKRTDVSKPLDGFIAIPGGFKHNLSMEVVRQLRDKLVSSTLPDSSVGISRTAPSGLTNSRAMFRELKLYINIKDTPFPHQLAHKAK
jgi:hypothetical protein